MKLVIAIVQDADAVDLIDILTEKEYRVTKLATTGGFLKSGNTTLMIGVEKEKVDELISLIEDECKTKNQIVTSPSPSPIAGATSVYIPYPIDVKVGGATIFVVDVDKFVKI